MVKLVFREQFFLSFSSVFLVVCIYFCARYSAVKPPPQQLKWAKFTGAENSEA